MGSRHRCLPAIAFSIKVRAAERMSSHTLPPDFYLLRHINAMARISSRKLRLIGYWVISLSVGGTAIGIVAKPYVGKAYHEWNAHRHAQQASEFFAQGDLRRALAAAKSALKHRPQNVEATRVMAKSLDAAGAPEADQWWARLDTLQPHDTENTLARARGALRAGEAGVAEELLGTLDATARQSAGFHSVAAAIAMERKNPADAEAHWAEAARLDPQEKQHRLNLASLRMESRNKEVREKALEALQEMRGNPATAIEALRLLLGDAIRRREPVRARELADALVAEKKCTFPDKLTRLASLRMINDARATPYLVELRDAALAEPTELSALLIWMNSNELPLLVSEWVRFFPQELTTKPPVCIGIAEAYMRTADWQKLEDLVATARWGELDFMRKAFLACALENLGDAEEAAKEWNEALFTVRTRADSLERMTKFALLAKWPKRAEEVMRTLAAMPLCPRWVLDSLWKDAYERKDTAQLQKLSGTLAKADPKGIMSRNNYAFLMLLTKSQEGNPHQMAEALHREHPGNAMIASTYALSLYEQGKPAEAAAIMSALKPEDLRQPQIALYHAIFLIANGHADKAEDYLKLSAQSPMLPEEKALLGRVKADSKR